MGQAAARSLAIRSSTRPASTLPAVLRVVEDGGGHLLGGVDVGHGERRVLGEEEHVVAQCPDRAGRGGHPDQPVGQLVELPLVAGCGDADRGAAQVDARQPLAELEVLDAAAHVLGGLREPPVHPQQAQDGHRVAAFGGCAQVGPGAAAAEEELAVAAQDRQRARGQRRDHGDGRQVPRPFQRGNGLCGVLEQLVERGPVAGVDELAEQVPRPLPVGARVHGAQRPVHEARHGRDGLAAHPVDPGEQIGHDGGGRAGGRGVFRPHAERRDLVRVRHPVGGGQLLVGAVRAVGRSR